jgi:PAS domain S-box-containing protein
MLEPSALTSPNSIDDLMTVEPIQFPPHLEAPDDLSVISDPKEFLLPAIVDSCQDAIVSKDLHGIVTTWNPSAVKIFGYRPEEMIGQPVLRLIPPELHGEEVEILRKIRAGERIERYETVRVKKNGERVHVSLTISPIRDDTGRIIGSSKIAHDITERKRTEEARFRLAAIVESSEDAIVSKSLDGIVTSWNQAAQHMFGYTPEEMIGQSILRIIPTELHSEEAEILRKLRAGERIDHFETVRLKKNGEKLAVSLTISPVRDNHGRVIGTSKIARDISDRKNMERLLLQTEKLAATGRMAATMAHEINNPLEAVMNLIYLARTSCAGNAQAKELLETAEKEIDRVSHIARQSLGFYRDRGGQSEVKLHELIEDVLRVYQHKFSANQIRIKRRYECLRPLRSSRGEMIQIFSNLIANAVDAMQHGGLLNVLVEETALPEGQGIRVAIEDQGVGIAPENLSRIFEPFFTTKVDVGTGIGLWVTKQLVENRSGRIHVESRTDAGNSGTLVSVTLPFEFPKSLK